MIAFLVEHSPLRYYLQSVWRDEAFSILVSEKNISFFFGNLSLEPPLYYILLHVWIKLFGNGEIAARTLSLVGVMLATILMIVWAEKIFNKGVFVWVLPFAFLLNPMILYYAFEIRAYGWVIFFSVLTMYAYTQKHYRTYIIASSLAFFTHTYTLFVPLVSFLHYLYEHRTSLSRHSLAKDRFLLANGAYLLIVMPWMLVIFRSLPKLGSSWFYPVDFQLFRAVLGNMFVGYEGTPWYLWPYTSILSIILFLTFLYALRGKKRASLVRYFVFMVSIPMIIILSLSTIKPIFVNRYLLFVTISEIFLVVLALSRIPYLFVKRVAIGLLFAFLLGFNIWYPPKHPKTPIRKTIMEINALKSENDLIYAESPLVLFETIYYASDRSSVFLYNPNGLPFPWYVGDALFSEKLNMQTLPTYPRKAFIVKENGSYSVEYVLPADKSTTNSQI